LKQQASAKTNNIMYYMYACSREMAFKISWLTLLLSCGLILWLRLCCLMPPWTILQLYCVCQLYWWSKLEFPETTTDLS